MTWLCLFVCFSGNARRNWDIWEKVIVAHCDGHKMEIYLASENLPVFNTLALSCVIFLIKMDSGVLTA